MSSLVIVPEVPLIGRECKLSQKLAFAAGKQHLGNALSGHNANVPGAAVGDVGLPFETKSGQSHLNSGETEHILGVRGGETEHGRPADALPGEMHWTNRLRDPR